MPNVYIVLRRDFDDVMILGVYAAQALAQARKDELQTAWKLNPAYYPQLQYLVLEKEVIDAGDNWEEEDEYRNSRAGDDDA